MNLREEQERREQEWLSPHATLSACSRGRERPERKCKVRTDFQRDRDRIIHSKAFRRLKHKTQVFIAPEGDHFRTRLTHTLEVAQIARTIARALRLNEDLTEAIALGHDLGHTPFGHAGEEALNQVHPGGFRHNEQSLRVVDKLEQEGGLNLTWEVRDGIVNHTGATEPQTLEGQIVRLADRIAYVNHDIDDAIRGGILKADDLPGSCLQVLGRAHRERINTMVLDVIHNSLDSSWIKMSPEVQESTTKLRGFLFQTVYVGSLAKVEEDKAKKLVQELYRYYLEHPGELPPLGEAEGDLSRRVCDYIAGMTDTYAVSRYSALFVPKGFSLS
ncbi:MAG: deoxyguanosinetriphosphate triphosphohydrolase [Clostridia bacterium]|nr:MAG: deoxyguanosinetriphosphate triphosphohydrolase [Clostridia bacterium]